mmetsp:Transcript_46370/g.129018  ORF Transcript_46370/g.129018 Transcript_46370/m.129018 type:complete len:245 (-) Transcript_46370:69-803(-)
MSHQSTAFVGFLAAVVAVIVDSTQLHAGECDVLSMVQREVSRTAFHGSARTEFAPGDHVLVQLEDGPKGPDGSPMAKGSIIGKGAQEGSYNVHLWVGPPRHRERLNVPAELLMDAKAVEEAEAARKKEAEEEEAERLEAEREAERKAEAERRAAQLKAEEEAKREAERLAEEEELAKRRAEEEEAMRKASVHAKWEALKAERLKAAGAENATLEVQREVLRSEKFKKQLQDEQVHVRRKMQPAR